MIQYSTEIDVGGIIIRDPVTAITNIGIFLTGLICFLKLRNQKLDYPHKNWIYFFLMIGNASLVGVLVHGFSYYTLPETHFRIWWAMGVIQGAGITLAQFGWGANIFKRYRPFVAIFCSLQFGAFAVLSYINGTFTIAKIHIAMGLFPIMVYYIYKGIKGYRAERLVGIGILISSLTAIVHAAKFSFCAWFNHNDIAHVLIIVSLVIMYQGISARLSDDPTTSPA